MSESPSSEFENRVAESILSNINEAVIVHIDLEIVYVNTPATEITGYAENEMLGKNALKYVSEDYRDQILTYYNKRIADNKDGDVPGTYEIELLHKDKKTTTPTEISISQIDFNGEDATVVVLRDISTRKQNETEIQQINRAIDNAGEAIYMTDIDGSIQYVNDAFETITGYTESEALGANPRILKSGEMGNGYYDDLWETVTNGDVWEEQVINKRKSGELYHAYQTIAPVENDNGDTTSYVAVQSDITERVENKRKLSVLTENLPGIIYRCGIDRSWPMDIIRGTEKIVGYEPEEIESDEVMWGDDIIHPKDKDKVWETVQNSVENQQPFTVTYRIIAKNGDVKWMWEKGQPIQDVTADEPVLEGVILNVTERKKFESRFLETTRQLEVIGRVLRHNLQNDMNVILGNAQYINEKSSGEIQERAERIDNVGKGLLETTSKEKIITRVLTDSDTPTVIEVSPTILSLTNTLVDTHPSADIHVKDVEDVKATASAHFNEAFTEVVENAIIHSDQGTPEVTISTQTSTDFVEIHISDNGPGIPKMEREVLTKDNIEPLYHGSGLGLWLVHIIMSEVGGSIEFTDDPDGTTVRLVLPRANT